MIIDLILDRKDGHNLTGREKSGMVEVTNMYNARRFYNEVMSYYPVFKEIVEPIANALDSGNENDIKAELCSYIIKNEYNLDICKYIVSVEWLSND